MLIEFGLYELFGLLGVVVSCGVGFVIVVFLIVFGLNELFVLLGVVVILIVDSLLVWGLCFLLDVLVFLLGLVRFGGLIFFILLLLYILVGIILYVLMLKLILFFFILLMIFFNLRDFIKVLFLIFVSLIMDCLIFVVFWRVRRIFLFRFLYDLIL